MTNREYIQSLSDEEFAKHMNIYEPDAGFVTHMNIYEPDAGFVTHHHICDYKHEGGKRCKEMNDDCHACMVDFLRAEHIEEEK